MSKIHLTTMLVAAAALAGCDQSAQTLNANEPYDPRANATNSAAPITMPASIAASHTYRCKDNSLLYIDWMSDGSARVKASREATATAVAVGAEGPVTGDPQAETITYEGQSCTR